MPHLSIYAQIFIQNTFCQSLTKQFAKYHFGNFTQMVKIKTAWLTTRRNLETYQQRGV